jgi:hypothetical protein
MAYLSNYVLMAMRLFKHLRRGLFELYDDAVLAAESASTGAPAAARPKEWVGVGDESLRLRLVETVGTNFAVFFEALYQKLAATVTSAAVAAAASASASASGGGGRSGGAEGGAAAVSAISGAVVYPSLVVHSDLCYLIELIAPFAHAKVTTSYSARLFLVFRSLFLCSYWYLSLRWRGLLCAGA